MKDLLVSFVAMVLAAGGAAGAEKPKPNPDVLVVADAIGIPEGFRPSPGNPVYYILVGKTELTLGTTVAGIKMPDPKLVEDSVVAALASQGFVRTQIGGPIPSICILVAWGDTNFHEFDDPPPPPNSPEARIKETWRDRNKVEALMGTRKIDSAGSLSDEAKIAEASNEDRLYVMVAALDPTELRKKNKRLLWRTSMSIDGRNKLADALPVMLASAAPFFGLDSNKPVFVGDADRRKADVNIGELKVVPNDAKPAPDAAAKK